MSFVGTWRAIVNVNIPGGSDSCVDQLTITLEPAVGAGLQLLRQDVVNFTTPNGPCTAMITSTFAFTVKAVTPTTFTCSTTAGGCSVAGGSCGITCGAPGALPDVTFTLSNGSLIGTGFPTAETFERTAALASSKAGRRPSFHVWHRNTF